MDTHAPSILLSVPADLAYSQMVRQTLKHALELTSLPACWVYRMMLVLDELFMNAVKYGSSRKDTVQVELITRRTGVILRVSDAGFGHMTPQRLGRIIKSNAQRDGLLHVSGRGLALIAKAWTDKLTVRRSEQGGIMVQVEKRFATAERDLLPRTRMHRRSAARGQEMVVHLTEAIFSQEEQQEFARLMDTLSDTANGAVCFDCRELGELGQSAFLRLLELYVSIKSRHIPVRWQHVPTLIEQQLHHLQIVDK